VLVRTKDFDFLFLPESILESGECRILDDLTDVFDGLDSQISGYWPNETVGMYKT
jgi:hypothetical protein